MRPIRLLHISDLHEKGERQADRWRVKLVLGEEWDKNLDTITRDGRPIDFICFTGDIAYSGAPDQYAAAQAFVARTAGRLSVPLERVYLVPGNHDIHRDTEKPSWKKLRKIATEELDAVTTWLAGGGVPRRVSSGLLNKVLARQQNYRGWVTATCPAFVPASSPHKTLGYRTCLSLDDVPFPIHIIGLDSTLLCGGGDDDGQKLIVTDGQAGRLLFDEAGNALPGLRVVLYHHPLSMLLERDSSKVQRLLALHTDIALRGHLHDTQLTLTAEPSRSFLELAAGCLYGGSSYPNSINIVDLTCDQSGELNRIDVWVRSWSERALAWADDNSVYAEAKDGRFYLTVPGRKRRGGLSGPSTPPPTTPPVTPKAPTTAPQSATPRAQAYQAKLAADAARARDVRDLRAKGIDAVASMFAKSAGELALGFEGPVYGDPDGEAKELSALTGPRGFLDLRRISITSHSNLRIDVIFKRVSDFIKPFPYPDSEEMLAEGACNILVPDQMWIVERIAVIARVDEAEGYALLSVDANRTIDPEWIENRIDVLIERRLPGITGIWRCQGRTRVEDLRNGSESGMAALRNVIGTYIHETRVEWHGSHAALANVLAIPERRRRQFVAAVFEAFPPQLNEYIDSWVRFDVCEIDENHQTALVDVELKPVGQPVTRIRYQLQLMGAPSSSGSGVPPRAIDTSAATQQTAVVAAPPPGFVTLDTFIKRETTRDIVSFGWRLPVVGRGTDMTDVLEGFTKHGFRLVPIDGAGGVGKTRFLAEVARRTVTDGIVDAVYCASPALDLHPDWASGLSRSQRCLLVLDDAANPALVRSLADELSDDGCRWIAIVGIRSADRPVVEVLARGTRNKFIAPLHHLQPLSQADTKALARKALETSEEPPEHVVSWVARMSQGVAVWLLLAAQVIRDGADLRDLPKDRWRLAERYVNEALPSEPHERVRLLQPLRWLALVHPYNREASPLVEFVCRRLNLTAEQLDQMIEELREKRLLTVFGVNNRIVEIRPAILRDSVVTSWLSRHEPSDTYVASTEGRALVDELASNHSSIDRVVLQRILSSLGRITQILGQRLPVLDALGDAVERAAASAKNAGEQLEALSLAAMAAPAALPSFIHAARTIRTTDVPDYFKDESWGRVTRTRAEVIQSLPWTLFVACQHARTLSDCRQLIEELFALVQPQVHAEPARAFRDGKAAVDLIPRLIAERFNPEFRTVLHEAARRVVADLRGSTIVPRSVAVTIVSSLLTVVVQYNWTDADKFVWGHYVIDPRTAIGSEVTELANEVLDGLTTVKLEPNALTLWELLEKYHEGLMHAMMEGSSTWNDQLLACLRACRDILTSRQASGREWFHARKVWHWHASYDREPARAEIARACEELFTKRPEFGPYFGLLFDELEPEEHDRAITEAAERMVTDSASNMRSFFESAIKLVDESGEEWRMRKLQALATKLGERGELPPHVKSFIASVGNARTPLFEAASSIVAAQLGEIRRSGRGEDLRKTLEEWSEVLPQKLLIEDVYLHGSVLAQAHLTSVDWDYLVKHLSLFSGDARWRLLGLAFAADGERTRGLVDSEATLVSSEALHEMIVWFWAGFHSRYIVEENAKRPALAANEFEWFLTLLALVPDLNSFSASFVDDLETVGAHHPKHSASWLCSVIRARRERFVAQGVAHPSGFWPVSHERLLLAFAAPAKAEDAPAIQSLIEYGAAQPVAPYGLAELVTDLDREGIVVPQFVVAKLEGLVATQESLPEIASWAEYASMYNVGTPAWRSVAGAACKVVAPLPRGDRSHVYWKLFDHRSGVWSGRLGEVSAKWTSAVSEAETWLEQEDEGPLRDAFQWHLEQVRADLEREQGRAQEEAASFRGFP